MPDIPSYTSGFAPRDGEAAHPQLWRGCVGAWHPGLGPTGLTLRDWSGQGTNGTLTNMDPATDWVTGTNGQALDFANSAQQHVSLDNNPSLQVSFPLTLTAWVKLTSTGKYHGIVSTDTYRSASSGNYAGAALLIWNNNKVTVGFGTGTGIASSSRYQWLSTATLSAGTWYHIAGVLHSTSSGEVYIDGSAQATTNEGSATSMGYRSDPGHIGSAISTVGFADAQMSDLRVYDRALSPNEIRLLSQRPGIAYELAPIEWAPAAAAPPAGNRRRRLLIGSG